MLSLRRPRHVASAALVIGVLLVTVGCSAGFNSTTGKQYAPSDGLLADSGPIRVLNALVVGGEDGDTGVISMTIVNRGDRAEQLTDITAGSGTVELTGDGELPPGEAVTFGAGTDLSATITGLEATPGQSIRLQLRFDSVEPITLRTVVVAAEGPYATLTSGAQASPSDTSSPPPSVPPTNIGPSPSGTATGTNSPTPSGEDATPG